MATIFRPPLITKWERSALPVATALFAVNLLANTLAPPAQAPFAQTDWQVPRGPQFPVENRTFLVETPIQLIGKDTFFGAPGQGPANLDWPVPKGPQRSVDLLTWSQAKAQPYSVQPNFSPYDWPNPRGPLYPVDNRTFLNPLEAQLVGQDKFFGGAGQGPANLDWPVPKGAQHPIENRTWQQSLAGSGLYAPASAPPFAQADWPVPKGWQYPTENRTFLNPLEQQLVGKDVFFGAAGQGPANLDWPVPKGPQRAVDLLTWTQDLNTSTLAPAPQIPTYQTDWPNPRGPAYSIDLKTHLASLVNFLGKDTFFGAPGQVPANLDWPVPKGYQRSVELLTWAQSLAGTILAPPAVKPFLQADWPNPQIARIATELKTWLTQSPINLGIPAASTGQGDWDQVMFTLADGSTITYGQGMRDMYAVLAGLVRGAGSGREIFTDPEGTDRITSYNDENGNRTRIVRSGH